MRAVCSHCFRPQSTCICDLGVNLDHGASIVVLQHPHEVSHPKGSAPLLSLCLKHVDTFIGEKFDPNELGISLSNTVLVYPKNSSPAHSMQSDTQGYKDNVIRNDNKIVVIDSTWRKSRKMIHLNPWLETLPRVGVEGQPSLYRVRKAEIDGQLSTFEATVHTLMSAQLISSEQHALLLDTFKQFNQRIAAFSPHLAAKQP